MEHIADWQVALLLLTVTIASAISIYAAASSEGKGKFLCDDCRFNNDTDCLKAEKPNAVICTAYRSDSETPPLAMPTGSESGDQT
jgi:hypothetical protein